MAGRGPAPKDPNRRARANKDPMPMRVLPPAEPAQQPELPPNMDWPPQTLEWWQMWADSPLSKDFTETDWSELRDTALLHAQLWNGDIKVASELRLRVAKFGATPEDRARLRITFAQAEEADEKRPSDGSSSRSRRGGLRALPEAK